MRAYPNFPTVFQLFEVRSHVESLESGFLVCGSGHNRLRENDVSRKKTKKMYQMIQRQ